MTALKSACVAFHPTAEASGLSRSHPGFVKKFIVALRSLWVDALKRNNEAVTLFMRKNYKTPLELGIVFARRESISTAILRALAKALNPASII